MLFWSIPNINVHRKQPCWHTAPRAIELTPCSPYQTSVLLGKGQGSNTSMFSQNIFFKAIALMSGGATFYHLSVTPNRICFFFFSELSTRNVDFATYFAGLYHKISFQSSDRKSHWESFLHLVNLTSGVFKGQLQSRWVRLWEHFTNPRVLATLQ